MMSHEWVTVVLIFAIGGLMFLAGHLSQFIANGRSISWQLGIMPGMQYRIWAVAICPHHVQYVGSWTEYFAVVRDLKNLYPPLLVILPPSSYCPDAAHVKIGDIITIHWEKERWVMNQIKTPAVA